MDHAWSHNGRFLVTFSKTPNPTASSGETMRQSRSDVQFTMEDTWTTVAKLFVGFQEVAECMATRFDFGISPTFVRRQAESILDVLRAIPRSGSAAVPAGEVIQACLDDLRELAPATYRKTLARIAGVSLIHAHFRSRMSDRGVAQAIAASSLYEIVQDLLDDLLDGGGLTFVEARRLYELCLRPLTHPAVSCDRLEDDLADFMAPGQDRLAHVLASATSELRGLLAGSDAHVLERVADGHEALTLAQAATVHLRGEALDIPVMREIGGTLPTPDPSLSWLDRLAIYASWPSNIALFDAGFTSTPVSDPELNAHARAWLFFDAAVTFLEHYAGAKKDSDEGIVNIARISIRPPEAGPDGHAFHGFSATERNSLFEKATSCLVRAIREGTATGHDAEDYVFMALIIPTVIFAMARTPPAEAEEFLGGLAAAVRSEVHVS